METQGSEVTPVLEVAGFSKRYGKRMAVEGLSLSVLPGHILGLVGPKGAGKTTLIRSIVGIQPFDEGQIRIAGMSVSESPAQCKQVTAYVPDNPDAYSSIAGAQYLGYMADMFGASSGLRDSYVRIYGSLLGLTGRLDDLVGTYSRGMRQKLMIVGALIRAPKLLVLDDPFAGLDTRAAHDLRRIMRDLAYSGSAVLFSSDILAVGEGLCDDVAIICGGRICSGSLRHLA